MNKLVTIFGGTENLEKYIIYNLANSGYNINFITQNPEKVGYLKTYGFPGQISITNGDISNYTEVTSFVKISNIIINCIEINNEKKKNISFVSTFFPGFLAECAMKYNIEKYIHISSISAILDTESEYGKAKLKGEIEIMEKASMKSTIIRVGHIISNETKYILSICQLANLPIILIPNRVKVSNVCVSSAVNIAQNICNLITDSTTNSKVYNLVNEEINNLEFIKSILLVLNKNPKLIFISNTISDIKYKLLQSIPSEFISHFIQMFNNIGYLNTVKSNSNEKLNNFAELGIISEKWSDIVQKVCIGQLNEGIFKNNDIRGYY